MVPGVVERVARYSRWNPSLVQVVPNVPLISSGDPAFVSPDVPQVVEELVDIELHRLRQPQVASPKINIVSEVVQCRNQRVILVRQTLRRKIADEVIVPQSVAITLASRKIHLSRLPAH